MFAEKCKFRVAFVHKPSNTTVGYITNGGNTDPESWMRFEELESFDKCLVDTISWKASAMAAFETLADTIECEYKEGDFGPDHVLEHEAYNDGKVTVIVEARLVH